MEDISNREGFQRCYEKVKSVLKKKSEGQMVYICVCIDCVYLHIYVKKNYKKLQKNYKNYKIKNTKK